MGSVDGAIIAVVMLVSASFGATVAVFAMGLARAAGKVEPVQLCRPATKCSGYWTAPHTLVHTDDCPLTGEHPDNLARGGSDWSRWPETGSFSHE